MTLQTDNRTVRALLMASATALMFSPAAMPMIDSAHAEAVAAQSLQLSQDGSFAPIIAAVKPAVVTVMTKLDRPAGYQGEMPQGMAPPFDEFFRRFFENGPGAQQGTPMPNMRPDAAPAPVRGLGSGVIIDPTGLIVTNNHVVDGANSITVTLDDGRDFDAELVGTDPKTDLAVLRIKADGPLPSLEWGDSNDVRPGDRVIAIGNPFGIGTTVTSGIVSALGRDLHNSPYDDFLQIDAALNHGNSGGPLIDTHGHVIGIDAAIFSPNDGNVGVGFAIPSNLAEKIVAEIEDTGTVERGYLGVQIQPVSKDIAAGLGMDEPKGAIVASVEPGTPAEAAGLQSGDVIVSLNHKSIASAKDLSGQIADLDAGEAEDLGVWRDHKIVEFSVTLAAMPTDVATTSPGTEQNGTPVPDVGFSVSALTPQLRAQLGLDDGQRGVVVTSVDPDVDATDLRPGDVIVSVNSTDVTSVNGLETAIRSVRDSGRGAALLLVLRDGQRAFVAVPFGQA